MSAERFIFGEPEEGQPTLGVVYHVLRQKEIEEATGLKPMGYVVGVSEESEEMQGGE